MPPPPFYLPQGLPSEDEAMPQEESETSSEGRDDDPTSDYDPSKNNLAAVVPTPDGSPFDNLAVAMDAECNDGEVAILPEELQYDGAPSRGRYFY